MKHTTLCLNACLIACLSTISAVHAAPVKPAMPAKAAPVALSAETVNSAAPAGAAKSSSAVLLRAQILLDRARFSPGEIDGASGSNMKVALMGFQKKAGLPATGALDEATWQALTTDSAAALVDYTITDTDVAGPFEKIPTDMADKAKLATLGYESIDEALGERFHMSPTLLKRLNAGKNFGVGDVITVANVLDIEPLPKAGKVVVDRSDRTLTVLDTAGKVIAQYPSSTGSEHDPLPVGTWKVNGVSRHPTYHYNPKLFWDAKPGEDKAKIAAGPNNPVGLVWVDLSKDHYGIHGTPVPSSIGKTQSHGCIRLTNWDVTALTDAVGPGTVVLLQE